MLSHLERPLEQPVDLRRVLADFGPGYAANALIGMIFSASAPVAIILSVGQGGGLSEAEMASWLFGGFALNGLITILFCWLYRQPLVHFWTIPGTVLIGPALTHLSFPQVIGAYYVTGLLMLLLGVTGWVKRAMEAVPMPIVMGMVAGVFLRFGLELVRSLHADVAVAGPMVAAFVVASALPWLGRRLPPMLAALGVGMLAILLLGRVEASAWRGVEFVVPVLQTPAWSVAAMVELVLPLAITVLVVQNGQGFAVVTAAGHRPPMNAITAACGLGAMASAAVGAAPTCLTGPTNAMITASGERSRHYSAGIFVGLLAIAFGVLSPTFTRLMLATPRAFIMTLAGLAMLRVLQTAFVTAFKDRFAFGALVALLVTLADLSLWNIGAAFWGLLAGFAASWLVERADFAAARPR